MKALKIIGIGIAIIVIIGAVVVAFLPSHAHMERSVVIKAQPEAVFTQLNSFKNFNTWSPWAAIDPNTKYEYTGPETGVGATMSWKSDDSNVGNGTQKIIESEPNNHVKNEMSFEGYNDKSYAEFILTPEGEGTKVTWTYDGNMSGVSKIFGALMDSFLGPHYEKGLAKLKDVMENTSSRVSATETVATDSAAVND